MTKKLNKVLVLYVGGTIGMQRNEYGSYVPKPNLCFEKVKNELHDFEIEKDLPKPLKPNQLVVSKYNILVEMREYDPLLDSSNMGPADWIRLAKDIEENYDNYFGFVVLHGTDTMSYTSSALSFMLHGLEKTVIISGAQIPIFETRSDAKSNLLSSLVIAGTYKIPEVCVFFANKLLRGNRTTKISSNNLDAFDSPNYPTLGDVGINIKLHPEYIRKPEKGNFKAHAELNEKVYVIPVIPTMTAEMLRHIIEPSVEGIILESYGVGNVPSPLLKPFEEAIKRNVIIVNITQCKQGDVAFSYETGRALNEAGVIAGKDLTREAALTKLMFVLSLTNLSHKEKVELMSCDIRGELSSDIDGK